MIPLRDMENSVPFLLSAGSDLVVGYLLGYWNQPGQEIANVEWFFSTKNVAIVGVE